MKTTKSILSIILSLAMLLTFIPMVSFATDDTLVDFNTDDAIVNSGDNEETVQDSDNEIEQKENEGLNDSNESNLQDSNSEEMSTEEDTVTEDEGTSDEEVVQHEPDVIVTAGQSKKVDVAFVIKAAKSNDEDIATVSYSGYYKYIYVYGKYVGTTEIILTDSNNVMTTLYVCVEAPKFELSESELTIGGSYNDYYYWNSYDWIEGYDEYYDPIYKTSYDYEPYYWIRNEPDYDSGESDFSSKGWEIRPTTGNKIVSVESSNTNIIVIKPDSTHTAYYYDYDEYDNQQEVGTSFGDCYDIHPVGFGTATITCTGKYGETATIQVTVTKGFMSSWIKAKSSLPNLKYANQTITGKAPVGAVVTVKIGGRTYKVTANSKGAFTISKIPIYKIGTKIYYSVSYKGCTGSVTKSIVNPGTTISLPTIYKKTKTVKVTLKNVRKGEVFNLKIGSKTYKKTITKTAQTYKFKVKLKKKKKAGSKIKATVINKYKQTVASRSGKVYYASKIKKGMTKSQCKLVPGWEYPDEIDVSGKYTIWWYDDDEDGFAIDSALRFKRGKLIGWYY